MQQPSDKDIGSLLLEYVDTLHIPPAVGKTLKLKQQRLNELQHPIQTLKSRIQHPTPAAQTSSPNRQPQK